MQYTIKKSNAIPVVRSGAYKASVAWHQKLTKWIGCERFGLTVIQDSFFNFFAHDNYFNGCKIRKF